jgi:hypothetical protein
MKKESTSLCGGVWSCLEIEKNGLEKEREESTRREYVNGGKKAEERRKWKEVERRTRRTREGVDGRKRRKRSEFGIFSK